MPLGTRPLGTRSLGDSAGEAMPRVVVAPPAIDPLAAGFYQWFMPGVSSPGGGIGWSTNVVIVTPTGIDDPFTRANSTTSLGSTPAGQLWVAHRGVFGISGNAAYHVANGIDNYNCATVDTLLADGIITMPISVLPTTDGTGVGITYRLIDANNWRYFMIYRSGFTTYLFSGRVQAGVATHDHISALVVSASAGDALKVDFNGSTIKTYLGAAQVGGNFTSTFGQTATRHGVMGYGAGDGRMDSINMPSGGTPAPQDNVGSDTGSGVESQSLTVARTTTETGSGVEGQSLTVTRTATDAASAAEGQSLAVARSTTETAAAVEAQAITASMSASDFAVGVETESVYVHVPPTVFAFAYLYETVVTDPETEGSAFVNIFENVVVAVPTPHIWFITPAAANRTDVVTIVGMGFGSTAAEFEGFVTMGAAIPPIEDWRTIVPGAEALSSTRSIDSLNDTVDPGHDRIDFRIPSSALSSDVKVYLNAPDIVLP